ncbi:MAG: hypothetical protein AABX96_02230 [Nanoarchaeota archaeon]
MYNYQKIDTPLKRRGLIGARFLDARSVPRTLVRGFQTLRHEVIPNLQRILNKLFKKDKTRYEQVMNKIEEIINSSDVEHYKNLRYDLSDKKRVQIGHFVLVFSFIKSENKIKFLDFDHHDVIYEKR